MKVHLLVACLLLGTTAQAQEAEPVRALEGKLCFVDGELGAWLAGTKKPPRSPTSPPTSYALRASRSAGGLCPRRDASTFDDRDGWAVPPTIPSAST